MKAKFILEIEIKRKYCGWAKEAKRIKLKTLKILRTKVKIWPKRDVCYYWLIGAMKITWGTKLKILKSTRTKLKFSYSYQEKGKSVNFSTRGFFIKI